MIDCLFSAFFVIPPLPCHRSQEQRW